MEEPISNEVIKGNVKFTIVELPKNLPRRKDEVLSFIKTQINEDLSGAIKTDEDGVSKDYVFRGFTRLPNKNYDSNWTHRYSSTYAESQLQTHGFEYHIVENQTDNMQTTALPREAIGFAVPKHDEIGYLVIYDNKDHFFSPPNETEWVNWTEIDNNTDLSKRVKTVIVLKGNQSKPGIFSRITIRK